MHNDTNRRERGRFQFGNQHAQVRDRGRDHAHGRSEDGLHTDVSEYGDYGRAAEPVRRAPSANMANLSLEARTGRAQVGREVQSAEAVLRAYPAANKQTFRAPKGYVRSDERIHEEVCRALGQCEALDLGDLEIGVSNGEVTLSGTVPERGMKYLAEQLTEDIGGVRDVHNQLKLRRSGEE